MDNDTKLSSEQLNSITQELIKDNGKEKVDLNEFMDKHLNEKQRQAVAQVIENPERLKALLSSPIAQRLMKQLEKKETDKE